MQIRILGPLQLDGAGRTVVLAGRRERVVLSMLALNANRVIALEQIADAVWDTRPPSTHRAQIQMSVSLLRRLLRDAGCAARIVTRQPGYLLEIDQDELDSQRFDRLVESARTHERGGRLTDAVAALRRALGLWRGPALADVPSEVIGRAAARLDEHRITADVHRLRLELALGRHVEIIGDLQALIDEHPLREELYGYLMLALYRSQRQSEALEVFRRVRATLVEEVGIEPVEYLRDLERAILAGDKDLAAPVDAPAPPPVTVTDCRLPAGIADFSGRDAELTAAVALLGGGTHPVPPGVSPVAGVSGQSGVGKSCLAIQTAHRLAERYPNGYLYASFRACDGDVEWANVLVRFLQALGVPTAGIPDDAEARVRLYRARLAGRRVLVVLDDVATEQSVLPLLPATPGCAALVTSRCQLGALHGTRWLHLARFDRDRSLSFLADQIGDPRVAAERAAAIELAGLCAGLPLALRIAGARLVAKPHWRIADLVTRLADEGTRLDELSYGGLELRSNIALSYQNLAPDARRLFRLLALIEEKAFPKCAAAALLDTDLRTAELLTEDLIDAGLLDVVEYADTGMVRCTLHDLIRVYARERLMATESADERDRAVRRLLGGWLAYAELAHRDVHGGDHLIVHGDFPRWTPPDGLGHEVIGGMRWFEHERTSLVSAARHAAAVGLDELCWDLALVLVTLFEHKGCFDEWAETSRLALDLAERSGNRRGRAAMLYSLGALDIVRDRTDHAERRLTRAHELFESEGDLHGSGLVLRKLAMVESMRGRLPAMLATYDQALAALREVGDRVGEADILCEMGKLRIPEGDERARGLLEEALAISRDIGCRRGESAALCALAQLYLVRGGWARPITCTTTRCRSCRSPIRRPALSTHSTSSA